jgi:hypothetical protein
MNAIGMVRATRVRAQEPETESESQLQAKVIGWLRVEEMLGRISYFAIANGEKRTARTGKKLQSQGVRAGVYDLCVCWFNGVGFIELKTESGKVSDEQKGWQTRFNDFGIPNAVCRSLDEVKQVLNEWMSK